MTDSIIINGLTFQCSTPKIDDSDNHYSIILTVSGRYMPIVNVMHLVYKDHIYHGQKELMCYDEIKDITKYYIWVDKVTV